MEEEAKKVLGWKRNLSHLEWLIKRWDMYEFPAGLEYLKNDITTYAQDKRRYYSRAVEVYDRFCENLYNDPCQYELGISAETGERIMVKDPEGYLVRHMNLVCPWGFLRENTGLEKQIISSQIGKWKHGVTVVLNQLESLKDEWEEQHQAVLTQMEDGGMQKTVCAWMYTLVNMTGLMTLGSVADIHLQHGTQQVLWPVAVTLALTAWFMARTWKGIHAVYLGEKGKLAEKAAAQNQILELKLRAAESKLQQYDYQYYFGDEEPRILTLAAGIRLEDQFNEFYSRTILFYGGHYKLIKGMAAVVSAILWECLVCVYAACMFTVLQ